MQSHIRRFLSTPVMLIGLSLSCDPGNYWTKPSMSPKNPECG